MVTQQIILTPFKKALASLDNALAQPKNEFTRDAVIQRFEYTFELAWKMLKRHIEQEVGSEQFSIKNLFRDAGRLGLINNVDQWFSYHKARNLTSHTYNERTAEETFQAAQLFAV